MPSQRGRVQPQPEEAGRRLRALALHGAASNSSIMKFQCSQLRRYLGGDVEWLFPDSPQLYDPELGRRLLSGENGSKFGTTGQQLYFREPTDFEKRLSQGKPLCSWIHIDFWDNDGVLDWASDFDSLDRSVDFLKGYFESNAPIDIAVAWSQGCFALNKLAALYGLLGQEPPWRISLQFCPTAGRVECPTPMRTPAFTITSGTDQVNGVGRRSYDNLWSNITDLEHDDGFAFPATPPRAQQIYEQLAFEVRYHCMDEHEESEEELEEAAIAAEEQPHADVPGIAPQQLAEFLLEGSCAVADARAQAAAQARPFPGAALRVGIAELRLAHPRELGRQLAQLREGTGPVVVVAEEVGDSCREYCALLVSLFGVQAERLRCLEGGVRSWYLWEMDNQTCANKLRHMFSMPPLKGANIEAITAEELAAMLLLESCVVLDAREPREVRSRAFPGAVKDVGLLTLQRKPQHARSRLADLLLDARPLVAVSTTGGRCRRYCAELERLGCSAGRLRWLDGGIRSWDDWAFEHWEESDAIRAMVGLSSTRGRPLVKGLAGDDGGAAQREYSLGLLN